MSVVNYLSIGSDNLLILENLQDETTKAYLEGATVTGTVKDKNGVIVAAGIALSFVAGSQGKYVGNLPKATTLIDGEKYTVEVLANDGVGRERTFVVTAIAAYTN